MGGGDDGALVGSLEAVPVDSLPKEDTDDGISVGARSGAPGSSLEGELGTADCDRRKQLVLVQPVGATDFGSSGQK